MPLPPFEVEENYTLGPTIFTVPRVTSTPNTGRIIAYIDPESEYAFNLLKLEEQDNINKLWKGIKLEIRDSATYVSDHSMTKEVPMSWSILNNVKIK